MLVLLGKYLFKFKNYLIARIKIKPRLLHFSTQYSAFYLVIIMYVSCGLCAQGLGLGGLL